MGFVWKSKISSLVQALKEQIVAPGEVPMGEFDRKMDLIVTADGILSGLS